MRPLFAYRFLTVLLLAICTQAVFTQTPAINWQRTLGGSSEDLSPIPIQMEDGYLVAGWSESDASGEKTEDSRGDYDYWLLRLNESGEILWDKTIGGEYFDILTDVKIIDGNVYLLGFSISPISGEKTSENFGGKDFWLVCMDLEGEILWDKSYGGEQADDGYKIEPLNNGNLLLFGTSSSGISGNKTDETNGLRDIWILEIDTEGKIIKQKSIGSENYDDAIDLTVVNDRIFLLGLAPEGVSGDKTDEGFNSDDFWVVEIDMDFNVVADKCFGGESSEFPINGGLAHKNGYLYLAGTSQSEPGGNKTAPNYGGRDYWVIKCDLDLNIEWDKSFGGTGSDKLNSFELHGDDKLVMFGHSASPVSGTRTAINYGFFDGWMVITDLDGNELVQDSYGGSLGEGGCNFSVSDDGTLLLSMSSESDESGIKTEDSRGGSDYWVVEVDASNYISVEEFEETEVQITAYPNPFVESVNFDLSKLEGHSLLSIYSGEGKLVFREEVSNHNNYVWKPEKAQGSLFFYELKTDNEVFRGKIIRK